MNSYEAKPKKKRNKYDGSELEEQGSSNRRIAYHNRKPSNPRYNIQGQNNTSMRRNNRQTNNPLAQSY